MLLASKSCCKVNEPFFVMNSSAFMTEIHLSVMNVATNNVSEEDLVHESTSSPCSRTSQSQLLRAPQPTHRQLSRLEVQDASISCP